MNAKAVRIPGWLQALLLGVGLGWFYVPAYILVGVVVVVERIPASVVMKSFGIVAKLSPSPTRLGCSGLLIFVLAWVSWLVLELVLVVSLFAAIR